MWIDTKDCVPLADGYYLVQTVYNYVQPMLYTLEGGWNTSRDEDGNLLTKYASSKGYVARWFSVEQPPEVPEEWVDEHLKKS